MQIEIAVKKVQELTDDELFRYAQLCEVEVIEYKKTIQHFTPEQMLKHGVPYIQSMRDKKATFLSELEARKKNNEKQQSEVRTSRWGFGG